MYNFLFSWRGVHLVQGAFWGLGQLKRMDWPGLRIPVREKFAEQFLVL